MNQSYDFKKSQSIKNNSNSTNLSKNKKVTRLFPESVLLRGDFQE